MEWQLLVPVKAPAVAKSRLALPPDLRSRLTLAMAADVLAVAESVCPGQVSVIGDDAGLDVLGVPLIPGAAGGLNAAVRAAVSTLHGPVAVVAADLPALRADELAAVLSVAAGLELGAVSDTPGTGTTMLTAARGSGLFPSYGEGSFARHLSAGAHDLAAAIVVPGLQRDVDTVDDLRDALALGVGGRTRQVIEAAGFDVVHLPAS